MLLELTDDELVLLDQQCRPEIQRFVDAARDRLQTERRARNLRLQAEGWRAWHQEQSMLTNPHGEDSEKYDQWLNGWYVAHWTKFGGPDSQARCTRQGRILEKLLENPNE